MSRIQAVFEVHKRLTLSEYYALLRLDIGADVALIMDLGAATNNEKMHISATSNNHAGPSDRTERVNAVSYDTLPLPGLGAEHAAS